MSTFHKTQKPFFIYGFLLSFLFFFNDSMYGQTISVGSLQDEQLQLEFLLQDSLAISPVNRPSSHLLYRNTFGHQSLSGKWWNRPIGTRHYALSDRIDLGIHPVSLQNTFNTRLPYGENNAAAWYGRGYNTEFKGGFYLLSKYVTLNIHPHIVYQ